MNRDNVVNGNNNDDNDEGNNGADAQSPGGQCYDTRDILAKFKNIQQEAKTQNDSAPVKKV